MFVLQPSLSLKTTTCSEDCVKPKDVDEMIRVDMSQVCGSLAHLQWRVERLETNTLYLKDIVTKNTEDIVNTTARLNFMEGLMEEMQRDRNLADSSLKKMQAYFQEDSAPAIEPVMQLACHGTIEPYVSGIAVSHCEVMLSVLYHIYMRESIVFAYRLAALLALRRIAAAKQAKLLVMRN